VPLPTPTDLLKACDTLNPTNEDKRINIARAIFEECCKAGYVNNFVLNDLRKVLSKRNSVQLFDITKCCFMGLPAGRFKIQQHERLK
jgi:hypothetical protein